MGGDCVIWRCWHRCRSGGVTAVGVLVPGAVFVHDELTAFGARFRPGATVILVGVQLIKWHFQFAVAACRLTLWTLVLKIKTICEYLHILAG